MQTQGPPGKQGRTPTLAKEGGAFTIPAMREVISRPTAGLRVLSLMVAGGLTSLSGCGPAAELQLVQPQLAGRQQSVQLHSDRAYWSPGGQVDRVLIELPLPGASTGRPTFLLYLRIPAGVVEPAFCTVTAPATTGVQNGSDTKPADAPPGSRSSIAGGKNAARGFFIQTRGDYAGLALITGGTIGVRGESTAAKAVRELRLELVCEDGSRIAGRLTARRDDWSLRRFEARERPADVQIVTEH